MEDLSSISKRYKVTVNLLQMIWKKILLLTVGIILFSSPVFSQNDLISLELVDSSGN